MVYEEQELSRKLEVPVAYSALVNSGLNQALPFTYSLLSVGST